MVGSSFAAGVISRRPSPVSVAVAEDHAERNRRNHAALVAAMKPQPPTKQAPPLDGDPIPGFVSAEAAEVVAQEKRDRIASRMSAAQAGLQRAHSDRAALTAQVAAGDTDALKASAKIATTIREAEALISILRDALPAAEMDLAAAQKGVDKVLRAEANRMAVAARERHARAEREAQEARDAMMAAAEDAAAAQRVASFATDRSVWRDRIAASRAAAEATDAAI